MIFPVELGHAQILDDPPPRRAEAAIDITMAELELMSPDMVLRAREWTASFHRRQHILPIADTILGLPEEEIDIWKVSLTLARDAEPDLDMGRYTAEFNEIVGQARRMTPPSATADYRVRALNTLLYKRLGYAYDKEDYLGKKFSNRYAFGIIKTKKGTCSNMATFYIALAQRLGYPVYAVGAPQHFFARYVDPTLKYQNIEPTGNGGWDSDKDYIRNMEIPDMAVQNGAYLRTMTHREFAAEQIVEHASFYYAQKLKDYPTAIALMEKAIVRIPKSSDTWRLLGQTYKSWGAQDSGRQTAEMKRAKGLFMLQLAQDLGVGPPLREGYWKKKIERGPGS